MCFQLFPVNKALKTNLTMEWIFPCVHGQMIRKTTRTLKRFHTIFTDITSPFMFPNVVVKVFLERKSFLTKGTSIWEVAAVVLWVSRQAWLGCERFFTIRTVIKWQCPSIGRGLDPLDPWFSTLDLDVVTLPWAWPFVDLCWWWISLVYWIQGCAHVFPVNCLKERNIHFYKARIWLNSK